MKLTKLEVRRGESYETDQSLRGIVELTGPTGKQAITLSPGAISRIIAVIGLEVADTAKANASLVKNALAHAQDEGYLLESDGEITL
jgi:hypothetical protein